MDMAAIIRSVLTMKSWQCSKSPHARPKLVSGVNQTLFHNGNLEKIKSLLFAFYTVLLSKKDKYLAKKDFSITLV